MIPYTQRIDSFDSALEFRWFRTLTSAPVDLFVTHHPGTIYDPDLNTHYEPDFLISQSSQDFLGEAKGDTLERDWKLPSLLAQTGLPGVMLYSGYIPPSPSFNHLSQEFARWSCPSGVHVLRSSHGFLPLSESEPGDYLSADIFFQALIQEHPITQTTQPLPFHHQTYFQDSETT